VICKEQFCREARFASGMGWGKHKKDAFLRMGKHCWQERIGRSIANEYTNSFGYKFTAAGVIEYGWKSR
jgi:hypothetical protein